MNNQSQSYARVFPQVLTQDGERIATQVIACLTHAKVRNLRSRRALDVGCSNGFLTVALASHFRSIAGIDTDQFALRNVKIPGGRPRVRLSHYDGKHIPSPDGTFDVVIMRRVYESADNPATLVSEIRRVLKSGGVVYFEGTNKYSPFGSDNGLPFFAPEALVRLRRTLSGKHPYYVNRFLGYGKLRALWKSFAVTDLTARILRHPSAFSFTKLTRWEPFTCRMPFPILRILSFISPAFIWIIKKPGHFSHQKRAHQKILEP